MSNGERERQKEGQRAQLGHKFLVLVAVVHILPKIILPAFLSLETNRILNNKIEYTLASVRFCIFVENKMENENHHLK